MSTGLELVPLALAIGAAVAAARKRRRRGVQVPADPTAAQDAPPTTAAPEVLSVTTRIRDEALLGRALANCGQLFGSRDGTIYGSLDGEAVAFARDETGTYEAHFRADTAEQEATRRVTELDEEYTLQLQRQSYEKVLERAPLHGLTFESETVEEDEIVLTLRVEEGMA